ncbi:MAG: PD40 domain-containing protein [Phycisphaerae bacterium]|nr:PD40 domain-containing protein [Phycisphaerae bacterium]
MKKLCMVSVLLLLLCGMLNAQVLLSEGFENGLDSNTWDWSGSNSGGEKTIITDNPLSGSQCLFMKGADWSGGWSEIRSRTDWNADEIWFAVNFRDAVGHDGPGYDGYGGGDGGGFLSLKSNGTEFARFSDNYDSASHGRTTTGTSIPQDNFFLQTNGTNYDTGLRLETMSGWNTITIHYARYAQGGPTIEAYLNDSTTPFISQTITNDYDVDSVQVGAGGQYTYTGEWYVDDIEVSTESPFFADVKYQWLLEKSNIFTDAQYVNLTFGDINNNVSQDLIVSMAKDHSTGKTAVFQQAVSGWDSGQIIDTGRNNKPVNSDISPVIGDFGGNNWLIINRHDQGNIDGSIEFLRYDTSLNKIENHSYDELNHGYFTGQVIDDIDGIDGNEIYFNNRSKLGKITWNGAGFDVTQLASNSDADMRTCIISTDMNGDSVNDIVYSGYINNEPKGVFLLNDDNTSTELNNYIFYPVLADGQFDSSSQSMELAVFNRDNKEIILIAYDSSTGLYASTSLGNRNINVTAMIGFDVNYDGVDELIIASDQGTIEVYNFATGIWETILNSNVFWSDSVVADWGQGCKAVFAGSENGNVSVVAISMNDPFAVIDNNAGNSYLEGSDVDINWNFVGPSINVDIQIKEKRSETWTTIATVDSLAETCLFSDATEGEYALRIIDNSDSEIVYDEMEGLFYVYVCDKDLVADIDGNCYVDLTDFALLASNWLMCGNPYDSDCVDYEEKIFFSSDRSGNWDIWMMNPDGTEVTQITDTPSENEYYPSISPDGTMIAYLVAEDKTICIMDIDGSNVRGLISLSSSEWGVSAVQWTPSGSSIAYCNGVRTAYTTIEAIDIDGTNARVLLDNPSDQSTNFTIDPTNPDVIYFAFWTSNWAYDSIIRKYDASTSSQTDITSDDNLSDGGLDISSNGSLIVWHKSTNGSTTSDSHNIWRMNSDGTDAVALTSTDGFTERKHDMEPCFSPDNSEIIFTRDIGGYSNLMIMDADGSSLTQLTSQADGMARYPSWGYIRK